MAGPNENLHPSGSYIRCMWLDTSVHDTGDSQKMQRKLCDIFGRCKFVDNKTEGHKVIKESTAGSKFVLVVSGQLGSELVPLVHADARVCAIYVYCGDIERHKVWSDGYTKVKFVTNNPNALIDKINTDKPNL